MLYRRVLERTGDAATKSEYEDRSVLALAESLDGKRFTARKAPVLTPAPSLMGLEDPTIVRHGGDYVVFYTGWSGWSRGIASLLWASGSSLDALTPQGTAIAPLPPQRFVKEAEYHRGLLWCEVDTLDPHERSRIAATRSDSPRGPWPQPVVVAEPRPDHWDSVNLSTGPLIEHEERLFMFYNGMVQTDDPDFVHAARIGLLELDRGTGMILGRSSSPMLEPPAGGRIAFAASIARDLLYYTVDDREIWAASLDRAALREIVLT
ncbi:MAG: hypothetical protein M3003_07910 [Candidatus Dormibacteraeota bacterium]|nr:hypothetical protein [Candidatus Dormibacteraeota bacterium]